MAILTDFLTGIADAIRSKKGTSEPIPAENFAEEISSIETGGSEVVLTELTVTQNGIYLPGEGVNGFSSVAVNVGLAIDDGIVVNAVDANGNWTDITIYGDVPAELFYAYSGNNTLQKVELKGTISIGEKAFRNCKALTTIEIPETVTSIGTAAFYGCVALTTVYWNAPAISSVGSSAGPIFEGCTALTDFIIGENVSVLPSYVLKKCTGLVNITIPDSVTTIGAHAFYGCTKLESVTISENVVSVDANAFYNCTALTTVYWNAPSISSVGSSSSPIFDSCSALTNFVIGDGVTILPDYMLRKCTGIVSVKIPNSVIMIGTQTFYNCTKLVSVQIGDTRDCAISSIASNSFGNCSALTDITIFKTAGAVSGSPWGASNATVTWAITE